MNYRNKRGWWRVLTLAVTVGLVVAEVVGEARRRRKHAEACEQIDNWENEGGSPPQSHARTAGNELH